MSSLLPRSICVHCDAVLPRAALLRCPLCSHPVNRSVTPVRAICRRCDRPLPRAHAGHCPACSVG